MIRARELTVRLLRNKAVGPFVLLLLAVALALLVIHEVAEAGIESLLAACATLVAAFATAFRLLRAAARPPRPALEPAVATAPPARPRGRAGPARPLVLRL